MNERTRPATTSVAALAAGEKPANPVANFSKFLDGYKGQMALALPKHLNADRMARLALSLFSGSQDLQRCTNQSIIAGIMSAAALGLEIGVNGHAYLIPYGRTATFVPGWKGLVDLVNRSGSATVWTGAVFEGDAFDYELGSAPFVKHKPCGESDPAKLTHVYACGQVNGAQVPIIEVWTRKKVVAHRDELNKQGTKHYSFRHFEMYGRKVVLLQVIKYMPTSVEVRNAIAADAAAEQGRPVVIDAESQFVTVLEPDESAVEQRGAGDTIDPSSGEIKPGGAGNKPAPTYAQFVEMVQKAGTREEAQSHVATAGFVLPADQRTELDDVFARRWIDA